MQIKNNTAAFLRLSSRPIPRVLRMMDVAKEIGYKTCFFSARRQVDLPNSEILYGHQVQRIGVYFPLVNGKKFFTYLKGVISYNYRIISKLQKFKPKLIHSSDIETMPAAIITKWLCRASLIYNIHDNLSERYDLPKFTQILLNWVEGLVVLLADKAIVPENFRKMSLPKWCHSKISVIRNTPKDQGFSNPLGDKKKIRIFFGGWIDSGRGIDMLLDMVSSNNDFELIIAGDGDGEIINRIKKTPNTLYLGFVDHETIMQQTRNCHIVAALYDPVRPINRHAASNKLAEAMSIGRPALINSEMLIAQDITKFECTICIPYNEITLPSTHHLIVSVVRSQLYLPMCIRARLAYEELYNWHTAKKGMEDALTLNKCINY